MRARPLDERFWEKVGQSGPTECWPWLAGKIPDGYGVIRDDAANGGNVLRAHCVAWELTHGPIPKGLCVLHHCDNPACCNPKHLYLGTKADNVFDMLTRGRGRDSGRNAHSRLTNELIPEVRHRYAEGSMTQRELAAEYNVDQSQISRIVNHHTWTHI